MFLDTLVIISTYFLLGIFGAEMFGAPFELNLIVIGLLLIVCLTFLSKRYTSYYKDSI